MSGIQYGVAWRDSYRLGDDRVDSQHYQIFKLVSELVGACHDGSSLEKVHETLDFLVQYTIRHFHDEESLQVKYGYPDYWAHKEKHEDFKVTVTGIVSKFQQEGSSQELSDDMNKVIVRWLIHHITIEDMKIGKYLKEAEPYVVSARY